MCCLALIVRKSSKQQRRSLGGHMVSQKTLSTSRLSLGETLWGPREVAGCNILDQLLSFKLSVLRAVPHHSDHGQFGLKFFETHLYPSSRVKLLSLQMGSSGYAGICSSFPLQVHPRSRPVPPR